MKGSFAYTLFQDEPPGTFEDGYVFVNAPTIDGETEPSETGYWHCDIKDGDKLSWSEKVRSLFGLPEGTPPVRDWAVSRYTEPSKSTLERVRTYALGRKLGFILDSAIKVEGGGHRWIRLLAVPIISKRTGRVVALHGLKRPL